MARCSLLAWTVVLLACGNPPSGSDGGAGGDAGASCVEPDRECPVDPPLIGSPCEGTLVCPYESGGMATCVGGSWAFDTGCDGGTDGGGCVPPLAEVCRDPFAGTLSGARVEVGPVSGAFRPFSDHEPINPEFGSQGGAMIAYRVRIDGVAVPPECVEVTAAITYDGMPPVMSHRGVTLHCGQTLGVFDVLPASPCELRTHPVTMTVEVEGVGITTATLDLMGGGCPRDL